MDCTGCKSVVVLRGMEAMHDVRSAMTSLVHCQLKACPQVRSADSRLITIISRDHLTSNFSRSPPPLPDFIRLEPALLQGGFNPSNTRNLGTNIRNLGNTFPKFRQDIRNE